MRRRNHGNRKDEAMMKPTRRQGASPTMSIADAAKKAEKRSKTAAPTLDTGQDQRLNC